MTRKVRTAGEEAKNKADHQLILAKAYQRVFGGNGSKSDADMVLADLANVTGYYRPPNYSDWMQRTKGTTGFELHCALHAARAEVLRHVMDFLQMTADQMVALEEAARAEARR